MRLLVAAVALGCAGPRSDASRRAERFPDPTCDALPVQRPRGAVLRVSRLDGESLTHVLDAALVADATCPIDVLSRPECVHLTDEAMDYVWGRLVAVAPHTIALERHGECIHCGGPWITIEWPGGLCERGIGHFHSVTSAAWERFARAVHVLEAAASAGGVEATAPPR